MPLQTNQRRQILEEMGIDIWSLRDKTGVASISLPGESSFEEAAAKLQETSSESDSDWSS
jgi:hypothetical protein